MHDNIPTWCNHPLPAGKIVAQLGYLLVAMLSRAFSVLPYSLVARFGSALGAAAYALPSRRKHVVLVNLRLCFPEKTEPGPTLNWQSEPPSIGPRRAEFDPELPFNSGANLRQLTNVHQSFVLLPRQD
ncbi:hypothetical protein [Paraburkholderia sp. RAU2J]|uniref:LpxL/LpxP family acyltransferase n=1 Tax=Paraburkholderia sp. RAU2J TaxID=1938810 RepID=UPI000EB44280